MKSGLDAMPLFHLDDLLVIYFIYFLLLRTNKPITPRTTEPAKRGRSVSRLKKEFTELGVDMTGTGDAKFANTPNSGDKRKARSKSRAEVAKKSKKDGGDGPLSGIFFLLLTCFFCANVLIKSSLVIVT